MLDFVDAFRRDYGAVELGASAIRRETRKILREAGVVGWDVLFACDGIKSGVVSSGK